MRRLYLILVICFGIPVMALILSLFFAAVPQGPVPAGVPAPVSDGTRYALDTALPPPRYYSGIDSSTLRSNDHLTLIPLTAYRQQMTNYSCGAVAAMTVMSYYGTPVPDTTAEEVRISHAMNPNVSEKTGINPVQLAGWLKEKGMNVTWGTGGSRAMLRENLARGIPTIVEWIDWGGHWVVVAGYDTRGTEDGWDDVIIFADSVDSHDDRVDGITYFNYGEFDAMWFDAHYFPEGMRDRVFVIAVPNGTPLPAG